MDMDMSSPPPPPSSTTTTTMTHGSSMSTMHMTFFWGSNVEILFSDWPGNKNGMYALALILVFLSAMFIEWLSNSRLLAKLVESDDHREVVVAGFIQTCMHGLRVGVAYLVMLAVMSFNGGVLLAAVGGHALGFLFFGSRVFKRSPVAKTSDLPPASC
ncbi:hypothetical protein ACFE04_023060 [Oxalis oulophora]